METPISEQDIEYAETYLAAGDISTASQMLERYLELAEEYIAEECQATDEVQYFSFQDSFERLCYARVEHDPRRIVAVPAPFDRLYSDVAYVCIQQQDYERARDALIQAVRWNPMNCKYRLDLAEIFRALGDIQEWHSPTLCSSALPMVASLRAPILIWVSFLLTRTTPLPLLGARAWPCAWPLPMRVQ